MAGNYISDGKRRDFWVYVDPRDDVAVHNIRVTKKFCSLPQQGRNNLLFIPNPDYNADFLGFFQSNLLRNYIADYHLERYRIKNFCNFPSRLESIFLFDSLEDAGKYKDQNAEHVGQRKLMKAYASGSYVYSRHDSTWIDFMRLKHSLDQETLDFCCQAYWSGGDTTSHQLISRGKPWVSTPVYECLLLGFITFYEMI